jgi:hypothetical protein
MTGEHRHEIFRTAGISACDSFCFSGIDIHDPAISGVIPFTFSGEKCRRKKKDNRTSLPRRSEIKKFSLSAHPGFNYCRVFDMDDQLHPVNRNIRGTDINESIK